MGHMSDSSTDLVPTIFAPSMSLCAYGFADEAQARAVSPAVIKVAQIMGTVLDLSSLDVITVA